MLAAGCCPREPTEFAPLPKPPSEVKRAPEEPHFAEVRQLTFGGENAEAYWSSDGKELSFQARPTGEGCDQIFRMRVAALLSSRGLTALDAPKPELLSTGKGTTTCSYFFPGGQDFLYSSTHLAGPECPPRPDYSHGYVWAIYPAFDIFRAKVSAPNDPVRLTDTPGYDAEATICPVDGSIVFTSERDGDLELYRMDGDGKNVVRLTHEWGYDGGAFFSRDCKQIVWRAMRPKGAALDEYRALLAQHLVRPTELELWLANADGSEARQVTYLGAASFAPYFFPAGDRIIFASNYGDPKGREFELWAIDADGARLERITRSPGFDGFPMFSPDGQMLAFSSNRATPEGKHDTNVFLARWQGGSFEAPERGPDRVRADVRWLAAPERDGRGVGSAGLEQAGEFVERRFAALGLAPGLPKDSYRQPFEVVTGIAEGEGSRVALAGKPLAKEAFRPLSFSASGAAAGELVFAGYGIVSAEEKIDDYSGVAAKDKIVVVRRFAPDRIGGGRRGRAGDLRRKAWLAREHGAKALVVVDAPEGKTTAEEPFPALEPDAREEGQLPVAIVARAAMAPLIARLQRRETIAAELTIDLARKKAAVFNVVARLPADAPEAERLPGTIVVGAHYDHLGHGGEGSLDPESHEAHLGADDNASGVAGLLEVARQLGEVERRRRDVIFVAFSGEELGVLGSSWFVKNLPPPLAASDVFAMLNMDMIGRMRGGRLIVLGGESAAEWPAIVGPACDAAGLQCTIGGDGFGRSDHMSFFAAGIPALHFFTGAHADYHKPSDSADRIHAAGLARTADVVAATAVALFGRTEPLHYQAAADSSAGDAKAPRASLGTIPDYAGPPNGEKGMLLAGVKKGGPAEAAGMRRGDILVKLGPHPIGDARELMFALGELGPGDKVKAVILRDGQKLELDVVMGKIGPHR